jgi:hypothetical protein
MQEPQKQSTARDVLHGIDDGGFGFELIVDGVFAAGEFAGEAVVGILDGISIDI